jgi:tight adherence protein B
MQSSILYLILALVFAAVVITVQTVTGLAIGAGGAKRINRRLSMIEAGMSREEVTAKLLRSGDAPRFVSDRFGDLYAQLALACRQAGLPFGPTRLVAIGLGVAGALWIVGLFLSSLRGGNFLIDAPTALIGSLILSFLGLWYWVNRRRTARLKKFEQQLPLALDVVTRAIRAGHPVIAAVQLAADEQGDPIGTEFGLIVDETAYGAEFNTALENFAKRTGSADARFFAVAVSIQSNTGGNLAEILEALCRVMRARGTLVKKVKALSSEGMASAWVLSALPLGLIGITMVGNPTYYTDKFSDPVFWPFVMGILALYAVGWVAIQRIVHFKY